MLEGLGIPADDDLVYLAVLRHPRLTAAGVAEQSGLSPRTVQSALTRLCELGVVGRLAGRPAPYLAVAPDIAVDLLLARHQQAAALARAEATLLLAASPTADPLREDDRLELVTGLPAVQARVRRLLCTVEQELLVLDGVTVADVVDLGGDVPYDLAQRGVRARWISSAGTSARSAEEGGAQMRMRDRLPTELMIIDRAVALLPFSRGGSADERSVLVIHSPPLLGALVMLFEVLWQDSVPVARREGVGSQEREPDRQLLFLLAAGLKDETIAGKLGVSLRTVHRRTRELLDRLGAQTRFQAGVRVVQSGLLPDDRERDRPGQ